MARPRSDIRRRVLHTARERFLHEGVDGASLRRIADDAGTSIGMVYYYFPTKDDLFLAVVEEVYQGILADLLLALEPSLPVAERIRRLYARVGALSEDERMIVRLVVREALVSSKRLDRIIERFQSGHLPLMLKLIADGLVDGTFDASIPPMFLIISMMALGGPGQLLFRAMESRSPFPPPIDGVQSSERMLRILLEGVGAKPRVIVPT
jgi:TetR/AcrR family transcriptional regulator